MSITHRVSVEVPKIFRSGKIQSCALFNEFVCTDVFFLTRLSVCPISWAVELGLKTSPGAPFTLSRQEKREKQNTSKNPRVKEYEPTSLQLHYWWEIVIIRLEVSDTKILEERTFSLLVFCQFAPGQLISKVKVLWGRNERGGRRWNTEIKITFLLLAVQPTALLICSQ